jgi:DNA-binding MarR family transcriptional regulator
MEPIEFKNEVWEFIRNITNQMDTLFRSCYESYGLTVGQTRILFLLSGEKKMSVTVLSRLLGVTPGNLSAACKLLEKKGLLVRQRDSKDERVVLIFLSEKGKETLCKLQERLDSRCRKILGEIPEKDLEIIMEGMKLMSNFLNKACCSATENPKS